MATYVISDIHGEYEKFMEFLEEFELYEELKIGGQRYLLVHGGLGGFAPEKRMEEYSLHDLVWIRPDYQREYLVDTYLVTGHTPTQTNPENDNPGYIYKKHHHIAIDCGACFPGGRLAAICLETGEEF